MKKILIFILLLFSVNSFASDLSWNGFTLLPQILSIGGELVINTSTLEVGAGVSKSLISYTVKNLFGVDHAITLNYAPVLKFQDYLGTGLFLDIDLSNYSDGLNFIQSVSGITVGFGWGKKLVDDSDLFLAHINLPFNPIMK